MKSSFKTFGDFTKMRHDIEDIILNDDIIPNRGLL
jgi:hypothetical protein